MEILPAILGVFAYLMLGSFTTGIIVKVARIDFTVEGDHFVVGICFVMWPIVLAILAIFGVGKLSYNFSSWMTNWIIGSKK